MKDKKAKQHYCWYREGFYGLDRSNKPQHSLKPKLNPVQGPNSLQFFEAWESEETAEEKLEANRGCFMRLKGKSHLHNTPMQGETQVLM